MKRYTTKSRLARAMALGLGATLIAGLCLVGTASAQAAPGDRYSITGSVEAPNSGGAVPLADVDVTINFMDVGDITGSSYGTKTLGDGSYSFASDQTFPDGDYTINFARDGYSATSVDVTVADANVTAPTATMLPLIDVSGVTATISGTGLVGDPLTVATSGWPSGVTFSYQWFSYIPDRTGGEITGATAGTYVVATDDIGRNIGVYVFGSKTGAYAQTEFLASNSVVANTPKKATAPAPTDLAAYLQTNGSTPAAQTTAGLPAGPLDPAATHNANIEWEGADSFVDVYIFSTPKLVGTFPVVNGIAQITLSKAVLGQLATGNHTLVATGQTSGVVQSLAIAIGLAATGADNPAVPLTVGSLLLLLGAALLVARRRLGHKA